METHDAGASISRNMERLVRQNSRVFRMIDQMVYHVDQIVEEAAQDHWGNIEKMSKLIADESQRSGYLRLCNAATRASHAAKSPVDKKAIRRGLIKLIGAVGRS